MPKLNGFEMLELIDEDLNIIFSTAYDQYALKAFEVNAIDYLLKPFSRERFDEAVNRVLDRIDSAELIIQKPKELSNKFISRNEILKRIGGGSIKFSDLNFNFLALLYHKLNSVKSPLSAIRPAFF